MIGTAMDRTTWYDHFSAQPERVRYYLLSDAATAHEDTARESLGMEYDVWDRVMDVVWKVLFVGYSREDFQTEIARLAGDHLSEQVEHVVLREVVLPLADLVQWDVEARLQELGVPLSEIQSADRVSVRPVSYGAAVRRIAAQAKLSILSEEMVRRARDILVSHLKGVRLIEQVKEILQRAQNEGGMGFSQVQTEAFVAAMQNFIAANDLISEQEYANWFVHAQHQAKADELTRNVKEKKDPSEEASEADAHPVPVSSDANRAQSALLAAIGETVDAVGGASLDAFSRKRLESIVSTRFRDVRNALQTKEMLRRDPKVGGLGLDEQNVERVSQGIENQYASHRENIANEEKARIESMQSRQQEKVAARRLRESEEHAKWFEGKVKSAQKEQADRDALFAAMKKTALARAAKPVQPVPSVRPSVDPVVPTVRLIGLTDELGELTLDAFRRLGKTPEEASHTIIAKLDALRNESFERWTEGVESWRRSPLQQQYLRLVAESFSAGKPVTDMVEEKRKQDPSLPTAEEIGVIMQLNASIRL